MPSHRPFQPLLLPLLLLTCLLGACGQARKVVEVAPLQAEHAAGAAASANTLAYEHTVDLRVPEDQIGRIHAEARQACADIPAGGCSLLQSQVDSGRSAHASLRLRASPAALKTLLARLGPQGEIVSQRTEAEELAAPLADTARALAIQTDYRDRLQALLERSGGNVEALLKIHKELAEVQGTIDTLGGKQALLQRRVQTEVLNLTIHARFDESAWRSVPDLLRDINSNLATGTVSAVSTLALLAPWALLLGVPAWGGLRLWRRLRRQRPGTPPAPAP